MGDMPERADTELIAASIAGDRLAFRALVHRYESDVARIAFGMLGAGSDAEDAGQETMIRLYRALPEFRGAAQLKTFVTRIAMNVCLDQLRHRGRRRWLFWQPEQELRTTPDPALDGAVMERRHAVRQALTRLKPDHRAVVLLRLVQGYSTAETANILEIAEGTVLSRLARARKMLARQLEDYAYD